MLDFYPLVERVRGEVHDDIDARLRQAAPAVAEANVNPAILGLYRRQEFENEVNVQVLQKAMRQGLPIQTDAACKADLPAAVAMQEVSTALHTKQLVSAPGAAPTAGAADRLRDWLTENVADEPAGSRRVLMQMLQVEDGPERSVLIDELAQRNDPNAAVDLAERRVYDTSEPIRAAAVRALTKRDPALYRDVLLKGLRYPWAPVADHAVVALVRLDDRKAVPALADLLGRPDPSRPILDPSTGKSYVRELVRVDHLRNCLLCHAPAPVQAAPIAEPVPKAGVALPSAYTCGAPAVNDFARADILFLQQDFSVLQPVANAAPWPEQQRFDYFVRTREATPQEVAAAKHAPADYPQREAVLYALRRLSGEDHGASTAEWEMAVARPADAPSAPPDPVAVLDPKAVEDLPARLTALKVCLEPCEAVSPDGKFEAKALGNRVVVTPAGSNQMLGVLAGHTAPVTSVWWSLDGKSITAEDAQGLVTQYDAASGQQRTTTVQNAD